MTTTEQAEQIRTGGIDTSALPVGAALRAKREQLGWSLPDVAAWLRIKLSYLEALEGGQVSKLPGNAYAFGFLRAYSGVLGLDAEDMSRRFRHESKEINRKPDLSFPAPVPERGVPAGAVVLLGVLVVVGAYAGWYEFTAHEHGQAHVVPPVPAGLLPYAGPVATPATSPQVATVMPGPGQTPSPLPQPAPTAGPPAASAAAAPSTRVAGPAAAAPEPAAVAALPAASSSPPAVPASPSATTPVASQPPAAVSGEITVRAVAQSWVQVRDAAGKVIYDHVLQAGDSWAVPVTADTATLTTGNAGGVILSADGVTTAVLGRNGSVRRNIPLSLASIRDGSVAVAAPAAGQAQTPAPREAASRHQAPARPAEDESADSLNARQLQGAPAH